LGKSYEIKLNIVKVDKLNVYLSLWNNIRINILLIFEVVRNCNLRYKINFMHLKN
jgi:hypothetical protein